jgi:hypothetical protein
MIGLDCRAHPQVVFAVIGEKTPAKLAFDTKYGEFDKSISSPIVAFWGGRGAALSSSAVKNYAE